MLQFNVQQLFLLFIWPKQCSVHKTVSANKQNSLQNYLSNFESYVKTLNLYYL